MLKKWGSMYQRSAAEKPRDVYKRQDFMGLKAVFFDLDDTLYTSFQAGDAYAYEKLEEWAIQIEKNCF